MPKKQKEYKRLPGKKKGFIAYNTLWLGKDHLLSVHSNRLSEDYKRFYLVDIEAITTRKTAAARTVNLILGLFAGLFCLPALQFPGVASVIFWIVAGLMLFLLLINSLRGPSCACHLRTAVQNDKLTSLNRLRTARKALKLLRPLIEKAQGDALPPEAMRERAMKLPEPESMHPPIPLAGKTMVNGYGGWAHKMLFSFLLGDGLVTSLSFFYHHMAISLFDSALSMGVGLCVIIALTKQHDSDMKNSPKKLTWITLGYFCFFCFVGYILYAVLALKVALKEPGDFIDHVEVIKMLLTLSPLDNHFLMGLYIFFICCSIGLGISGFILLRAPMWVGERGS